MNIVVIQPNFVYIADSVNVNKNENKSRVFHL